MDRRQNSLKENGSEEDQTQSIQIIPQYKIPKRLVSTNKYVMLAADVIFVSGLPFLVIPSWRVRYMMVQFITRIARELANALEMVIRQYK